MSTISIIGANGQVGSEVTMILNNHKDIDLIPISRNKLGSAFLRYIGIPCRHGLIANAEQAATLMDNSSTVVNFALGAGTQSAAAASNTKIIENCFKYSQPGANIIHISTIAVYGTPYPDVKFRLKSSYAKEKLRCEKIARQYAKKYKRELYILRLGQVCGEFQGITQIIRNDLKQNKIYIPAPDRASNTTFTATIADAILKIVNGSFDPPGTYDLLNSPQWSWSEVYQYEADKMDIGFAPTSNKQHEDFNKSHKGVTKRLLNRVQSLVLGNAHVKEFVMSLLVKLSDSFNKKLQSKLYVSRAKDEIAMLTDNTVSSDALNWREVGWTHPDTLEVTKTLLENDLFQPKMLQKNVWPQDR